ncbi:MAG: beta-N-acetylhexosaminidase [Alphaproteobacteria bacterium]|nr:beta-N-acetylhexosaminidase [Alphaproteobacteria bacterium]OJV14242.1 MAG: hypothetical protein BGO27_01935 [Alphaproteobacteria bacterium 33-17]
MSDIYNIVVGIEGKELTDFEKDLFTHKNPYGVILFARNVDTKEQLKALTKSIHSINPDINIFIDQEGGRVTRIKEPLFTRKLLAPKTFSDIFYKDKDAGLKAIYDNAYLIGHELKNEFGINGVFAPVCDLYYDFADKVIGDRSLGSNPEDVALMAKYWYNGILAGGCIPCVKHIPGHGRAMADSHLELPIVDTPLSELESTDFKVFTNLADTGMAMTAHVIFTAIDDKNPITTSKAGIEYIRNNIGFKHVIITDDLSMKALQGSIAQNAEASIKAGCDLLLHCNGKKDEMLEAYMFASPINKGLEAKLHYINNSIEEINSNLTYDTALAEYLEIVNSYA